MIQFPPSSQWHERYAALRAENRCVTCTGKILPEWPQTSRCPECTENRKPSVRKYVHSAKYKRVKKAYRAREDVRVRERQRQRDIAFARKITGLCKDCLQPCLEDACYCAKHQDVHKRANRDYERRKRESIRTGKPIQLKPLGPKKWAKSRGPRVIKIRPIKPVFAVPPLPSMDPANDLRLGNITISEAARRIVELHNGITAFDVGCALGASRLERNAISTALRRAISGGLVVVEGEGSGRLFYPNRQRRSAA